MIPGNILSFGFQVEAYCPPSRGEIPGVPEKAYQPPSPLRTWGIRFVHQTGRILIAVGERLASIGQPCGQWVEEMT
jgi:hypothetical protein